MKALHLTAPGTAVEAIEAEAVDPGPNEVAIAVEAAGICHSDVHYRSGVRTLESLPVILGHEVAGVVTSVGDGVEDGRIGSRVAIHYVVSCGRCDRCVRHGEQFCESYDMLGVTRPGGYAEHLTVPARNAVAVPDSVPIDHAAVMMCSTVTALHGLRRGRVRPGDVVAVYGVGGLGMSAIQLAAALGAATVYAVDIDPGRLEVAAAFGATPLDAAGSTASLRSAGGFDVGLDLVGSFEVLRSALDAAGPGGRVVSVGLTEGTMALDPFEDLIRREVELVGTNDHLLTDVHEVFELAESGALDLTEVVTGHIGLDAADVNAVMDRMEAYGPGIRTVIEPRS